PHMPKEWGGLGLGPVGMASVSAEAARAGIGPFVLNCQAPDEGNMHTLLHFGTDEQKETYLRPLCEGVKRSCFAMTEPEVAGSDPPGWPAACGGSVRPRWRSRCSSTGPSTASSTGRCWPTSRVSSG